VITVEQVKERLARVYDKIQEAGGDPEKITIVAVTKGFDLDAVKAALEAGISDIGENYAQELIYKAESLTDSLTSNESIKPRWHYLGAVQRRKVRRLAPWVSLWQAVASLDEGKEIARWQPGASVLIEVNVAAEPTKKGCTVEELPTLTRGLRSMDLEVAGLMTVAPPGELALARQVFHRLAQAARELELECLSMGMSDDYDAAVAEGATMIRVGRVLFGERPPKKGSITSTDVRGDNAVGS